MHRAALEVHRMMVTIEGEGAPPDFLGELFRFCE